MHMQVYIGDSGSMDILEAAGLSRATAIVITFDNMAKAEAMISIIMTRYPEVQIFARCHDEMHQERLHKLGATVAVPELVEPARQLGALVLRNLERPAEDIDRLILEYRNR